MRPWLYIFYQFPWKQSFPYHKRKEQFKKNEFQRKKVSKQINVQFMYKVYIYTHNEMGFFFLQQGHWSYFVNLKKPVLVTHIDGIHCISVKCRNMKFGILGELD